MKFDVSPRSSIKPIFIAAQRITDPNDRRAYLQEACGEDSDLRAKVEGLLAALDQAPSSPLDEAVQILASTQTGTPDTASVDAIDIVSHPMIGRYKLLERLGEGGMGTVYMAQQRQPVKRRVALKLIKPGMDSNEVIARFEAERQALAMMDHSNIARIFDGGLTEHGRPYFVMELVRGLPIDEYCDETTLSLRDRLQLFTDVCRAVQHAHQKGIIHRDLKPSNILITLHDGVPVVKVIDFGIAKALDHELTDRTLFTRFAELVGTPVYMSPEQAEMSGLDVDTRSDVYSLGVMLYKLLVGVTPFDEQTLKSAGLDEMRRIIREDEPFRPSHKASMLDHELVSTVANRRGIDPRELSLSMRRELDWIVMRALEKDRDRRYQSARALARDIQRYLDDEPVEACPPSTAYRLRKYARRHKAQFLTVTAIATVLIVATVVSSSLAAWAVREQLDSRRNERIADRERAEALDSRALAEKQEQLAKQQKTLAEEQKAEAQQNLYYADVGMMQRDWEHGNTRRMRTLLEKYIPQPGDQDARGWEWYYLRSLTHQDSLQLGMYPAPVHGVSWNPDGTRLAVLYRDGMAVVWDVATRRIVVALPGQAPTRYGVPAWSPDGDRLACPGAREVTIWDVTSSREIGVLRTKDKVMGVAWSPDGQQIAVGTRDKVLRIWEAPFDGQPVEFHGHQYGPIYAVVWSPDGSRLASGGNDRKIRIWNPQTGMEVQTLPGHVPDLFALDWSPDGRRIASAGWDAKTKVWDTTTGQEVASLAGGIVSAVSWSADGRYLASSGSQQIRIWETESFRLVQRLKGQLGDITALDWSPNGSVLASGAVEVRLWEFDKLQNEFTTGIDTRYGSHMAWSPQDRFVAYNATDKTIRVLDTSTHRELLSKPYQKDGKFAWIADGQRLATSSDNQDFEIWHVSTGQKMAALRHESQKMEGLVSWTPGGRRIASVSGQTGVVKIWDATSGELLHEFEPDSIDGGMPRLCWSPDGKRLATSSDSGVVRIWDAGDWSQLHTMSGHREWISGLAWNRDGNRLASGGSDRVVRIWDTASGKNLLELSGHTGPISSVAWSREGDRLASAGRDGTLRIWDTETGQEAIIFYSNNQETTNVAWSHDGTRILFGTPTSLEILDASWAYEFADDVAYDPAVDFRTSSARHDDAFVSYQSALEIWGRLVGEHPEIPEYRAGQAKMYFKAASLEIFYGLPEAAIGSYARAIDLQEKLAAENPDVIEYRTSLASSLNNLAWLLATCTDDSLRDSQRAVALAKQATSLAPEAGAFWMSLGIAHYRAGDWQAALESLTKSMELPGGGRSENWFFLAMAHWQLGRRGEPYEWYDKAVAWMDENRPNDKRQRFRAEAAELLGVEADRN